MGVWVPTTTVAVVSDLAFRHEGERLASELGDRGVAAQVDEAPGWRFG